MSGFENLIAVFRIIAFVLWTMFWLPVQVVVLAFDMRLSWLIPKLYHQGNCLILGLQVICHGVPAGASPVLFVSNHVSYLDIVVLAAHLEASFVAKREVAHWPLFGLLARLNRTVFVQRKAGRSGIYRDEMRHRLAGGKSLILFPEGTSSDGNRVLGFNSTFFSVAETGMKGKPVRVQPVAIAYTQLNGLPVGRSRRPFFAWYGDMDLVSHLWTVLGQGVVTVELAFLPYVTMEHYSSRKDMARDCQSMVAACVSDMLGGQPIRLVQAST
tara:strand:- start:287 stop:1096 length:810 start_codon:yes stop_codon:yes gene_type:complete